MGIEIMAQIQLRDITSWNEEFPGEYQMYLDLFLVYVSFNSSVPILKYLYKKKYISLKIDVLFCTNKLCIVEDNYGKMKYNII